MDNVLETNGVPLTVFGGAVPELAPEDLPEGASPFNQDVDFNPGSVFTRGGRQNQVVYSGLFVTDLTTLAQSVPGSHGSAEIPWINPSNAILDLPSTYTVATVNNSGSIVGALDFVTTGFVTSGSPAVWTMSATPTAQDFGVWLYAVNSVYYSSFSLNAPSPMTNSFSFSSQACGGNYGQALNAGSLYSGSPSFTPSNSMYGNGCGMFFGIPTSGTVVVTDTGGGNSGAWSVNQTTSMTVAAGQTCLISLLCSGEILGAIGMVISDAAGNTWFSVGSINAPNGPSHPTQIEVWMCLNPVAGTYNIHGTVSGGGTYASTNWRVYSLTNTTTTINQPYTQILQSSKFNVSIPAGRSIVGMQVLVDGHQTSSDPGALLTVNVDGQSQSFTGQLPLAVDGTAVFGNPTSNWNTSLTLANINSTTFKIDIVGTAASGTSLGFYIQGVKLKIYFSNIAANFNWMHTYEQTNGQVDTLALDSNGILFDEQVNYGAGAGTLSNIFLNIFPGTFAKGVTFGDIEYIAFSNLLNGTDIPRQWNGTNFDRISMVGPGEAPSVASSGGSGGGNVAIQNITQYAPVEIRRIAWGTVNSPADSTPGNLLVIFGEGRTGTNTYASLFPYSNTFGAGTTVVLSGIPVPFPRKDSGTLPYNINGTYIIGQVTTGIVGGSESCPIFTVPSPTTIWAYSADYGSGGPPPTSGWYYQSCLATVTLQAPLPNVGVGSSIQITGTGGSPPGGYDGTWNVLQAPNASQMTINSAQLTGGSCTFSYTLLAGSAAPVPGQFVTVTNCLNNGMSNPDPQVFNKTFQIASVGGGTFSVNIGSADTGFQNQVGTVPQATATIGGTIFVFDAGQIVGTKTGGTIVGQGQVGVGVRKVCYSFLTRSGFITQPSPIATFNVTSGSGAITVSGLSIGPSNVVARIVSFTGANGGNFFYIPQTVNVSVGGVNQVNTSTIVNDNTSTTATFSFSDAVLLSATAIDIPGNNLFNTIELGSSRGLITYSSRMIAWGEQQKVTNLRNLSFDGGFKGVNVGSATIQVPLGWQLDSTNGSGGSLNLSSPVFGWAYQIQNVSGSTQASWGMLTQAAYQDEFGVPIIQAATLYSVRITAQVNPVPASGNLVVDLYNSQNGIALGTFSLPLASMTTNMGLYTGTLLTTVLQPVPNSLSIRIWAQNIPTATTILIDRVEPFQTLVPANTTAFKMSYVNNQEAFDLNTGVCGPAQNMQPINGAMELFDLLYALKEKSWFSTFDNGVTEPFKWNWKEVSNKVGTIGINSYDWGEGWGLTGNRQGVYFFEGGEPIKVSQEIQPLWDLINWQYGYTMWVRNDPEQKRFMVGVPIPTPNAYMPEFPVNANPTSPNVILMCNYRELNTGAALAQTGPIRSTFTGRLMSPEPARKWSFWNIYCPYSDYISRANNQWPQWFGTGYMDNKIFQLLASQLSDDGAAINSFTVTYGFVKPEMQDAKGMGLFRMTFPYFTILATGTGTLNTYVYPESPFNRPYVLDPTPLPAISQGDLEIGVNIKGQRFFIRVGTNAVGSAFRCSKMVVPLIADSWSPVRGTNLSFA
jgi:hypothetical protein